MIPIEEVEAVLPGVRFTGDRTSDYQTLAGFVVKQFGRIPKEGETFESQGYVFEVLDMDAHRVDKVLIMPRPVWGWTLLDAIRAHAEQRDSREGAFVAPR